MKLIAEFFKTDTKIEVFKDNHGKWYVFVDRVKTQNRLTANEIVRYLANAVNRELVNDF